MVSKAVSKVITQIQHLKNSFNESKRYDFVQTKIPVRIQTLHANFGMHKIMCFASIKIVVQMLYLGYAFGNYFRVHLNVETLEVII